MIKFTADIGKGRTLVGLGLSFKNLAKFYASPGDTFIRIKGEELELPIDIIIFSGETEEEMEEMMKQFIGSKTKVHKGG